MNTHETSLKTYVVVYILLLVGLAATVGAAFVNLGPVNVLIMLLIAFAKATLVVLYFMHVRESPPLNWIAIAAGLVWLCILFGLTLSDFATRGWIPTRLPRGLKSIEENDVQPRVGAASLQRHSPAEPESYYDCGFRQLIISARSWSHLSYRWSSHRIQKPTNAACGFLAQRRP